MREDSAGHPSTLYAAKLFKTLFVVLWIGFDLQAEIEAGDDYNSMALHYAAIYGKEAVAAQLLQAGASVSAVDNVYGSTPMHLAAYIGKSSIANLLLQANASPTAVDKYGRTL